MRDCSFLNIRLLLFILSFTTFSSLSSLEKRPDWQEMRTSIIVPCHVKHFSLLQELLTLYKSQTVLPNEIVISISECDLIPTAWIESLQDMNWPFIVKIFTNSEKLSAGQNRNIACSNSTGDILICQDADDLPHPQRVEIIKYHFETYQIDHLMHFWIRPGNNFDFYQSEQWDSACNYYHDHQYAVSIGDVHNGNIAISRNVFNEIHWPGYFSIGEDVEFNQLIYSSFQHTVVIKLPLLMYRNFLSSFIQN